MGGQGSGFTREKRLVNLQLGRNKSQPLPPAGDEYAIPNHSGVSNHPEMINNFVPYLGAIKDVDLGSHNLETTGLIVAAGANIFGAITGQNLTIDNININNSVISHNALTNADLIIRNLDENMDIVLQGTTGVTRTITWDISEDKLKHSLGAFNFDDDDIKTTGDMILIDGSDDGVVMTGSGNGITMAGTGGANNETLNIDFQTSPSGPTISTGGNQIIWDDAVRFKNDRVFIFGTANRASFEWETSRPNNVLELGLAVGAATQSGYFSICEFNDRGTANRDPGNTANPTVRIWSSDGTSTTDYIDMYHDQTDGRIDIGDGILKIDQSTEIASKTKMTAIGGYAVALTNQTGANSVAGEVVVTDAGNDSAVVLSGTTDPDVMGVFLDSGIADGAEAWVVVGGIADVLADASGFTRGDRVGSSTATAGRVETINAPSVASHFTEVGHALDTAAANSLGLCVLHWN